MIEVLPPCSSNERTVFAKHWVRHERGELSFVEQRRARVREFLGIDFTDAEADQALLPYLHAYEASWQLVPGVHEFLERSAGPQSHHD